MTRCLRPSVSLILASFLLLAASPNAASQTASTISFQGYLANESGVAIDDSVTMVFALYDSVDSPVWTETQSIVVVTEGAFSVRLGSVTPFGDIFYEPLELGITVGTDPEMTPRTPLDTVPYSQSVTCERVALTTCASGCVDVTTDESHCGSCDFACEGMCTDGGCECPGGQTECSGDCADLNSDDRHCGSCGAMCAQGWGCCSGSCTDFQDEQNCHGCGIVCPTGGQSCQNPTTCQSTTLVSTCEKGGCSALSPVPDDSACGQSTEASNCGLYPSVYCTGEIDQSAPVCAGTCVVDSECDASAFCLNDFCLADLPNGSPCLSDSWCISGSCIGSVCV